MMSCFNGISRNIPHPNVCIVYATSITLSVILLARQKVTLYYKPFGVTKCPKTAITLQYFLN